MGRIYLRKYGVASTIDFELFEVDGVDFRTDAAPASGDLKIMKDEGAEANCANLFVDEGNGYSLAFTAAELAAARVVVYLIDSATKAWLDIALIIETYGNASAQHAMDFDDNVRGGMTALPDAAADAAGGLVISDAGGLDIDNMNTLVTRTDNQAIHLSGDLLIVSGDLVTVDTEVGLISGDVADILVDTAEIGTAGAGLTNINLPNQTMDIVGDITGNLSGSVGSVTGHTNQTADHTANIAAILGEVRHVSGDLLIVSGDIVSTLADTNETQGKLPDNNIMGSSDTADHDDEINNTLTEVRHISGDLVVVSGDVVGVKAVTDALPNSGALSDIDTGVNNLETAVIANAAGADISADIAVMKTDVQQVSGDLIIVSGDVVDILTDTGTTLDAKINDIQGAGFASGDDSLAAIRIRGDAAWITGSAADLTELLAEVRHISGDLLIVSGDVVSILADTALASVCTEGRLAELDAGNLPATTDRNETALGVVSGDTAAILVDTGTTLNTKINDIQGAGFSSGDDSLAAIRIRGDTAWITGSPADLSTLLAEVRHISGDLLIVSGDVVTVLADTNETQGKLPTNKFMGSSDGADDDGNINDILTEVRSLSGDTLIVSGDVVSIKTVTDNIPDSGSMNDLATTLAEARHISGDLTTVSGDVVVIDTEVGLISGDVIAIKNKTDNLPEGMKKNTALSNFQFFMADSSDHVTAKTGLTVTAERSLDNGAFASMANSATELSDGIYAIDLAAADTNADFITYKFTASGADATYVSFKTEA